MDTDITAVSFYMRTFWGAPAYEVDSFFLRQFSAHRLFAWGPGYEYVTHRPPTVLDEQRRNLETLKPVTAAEMKAKGIFLRHYELLFPKQVAEKSKYYAAVAWTSELKQAEKWLETCYNSITRPFRVHMAYSHISWLEHFTADHPPQIGLMMHAVTGGFHEGVSARQTSDIESLLSSRSYRVKRAVLRRLIPIDKFLAVMKAALRRILERTALWRALQRVKRVVARTGL